MSALDVAIENLYAVFAAYPRREQIEACPCCQGPQSTRPLHRKPLRELSTEDLHNYAFRAMTTIGDVNDFRHFLPRIVELLLSAEFLDLVDQEVVLSKLAYARWTDWPGAERDAVRTFLHCLWAQLRAEPLDPDPYVAPEISRWLCAIARAEADLTPYLDAWQSDPTAAAAANLARFIADNRLALDRGESPGAYWQDDSPQWNQVTDWLDRLDAMRSGDKDSPI